MPPYCVLYNFWVLLFKQGETLLTLLLKRMSLPTWRQMWHCEQSWSNALQRVGVKAGDVMMVDFWLCVMCDVWWSVIDQGNAMQAHDALCWLIHAEANSQQILLNTRSYLVLQKYYFTCMYIQVISLQNIQYWFWWVPDPHIRGNVKVMTYHQNITFSGSI